MTFLLPKKQAERKKKEKTTEEEDGITDNDKPFLSYTITSPAKTSEFSAIRTEIHKDEYKQLSK